MKLRFTLLLLLLTSILSAQAPNKLWEDVAKSDLPATNNPEKDLNLRAARGLHLNFTAMRQLLAKAPMENTAAAASNPLRLDLPMPDGSMQTFEIIESPVMESLLAAKFPEIQSFKAVSIVNKAITARIDVSPVNFHAMIDQAGRSVFIDPTVWTNGEFYQAYYEDDVTAVTTFACGVESTEQEAAAFLDNIEDFVQTREGNAAKLDLRTFRIAIATTGEFSQRFGGTLASVMSAINTAVNRANQVYERDAAIRLILMNNNDQLISLDPATDPYTNSDNGGQLIVQNFTVFASTFRIPFSDFDLGHVFTSTCTDVGGIAAPSSACQTNRAQGVSCFSNNNIEALAVRNFTHEVGHQFSATHTFDASCGNLVNGENKSNPATAFEPGCGFTIMSYSNTPTSYFHGFSIQQITTYTRTGNASGCAAIVQVQNNEPEASIPYQNDFYIPIQTPFQLTGTAVDADSDPLTYSWEELDAERALFPVLTPSNSSTRVFPNLTSILNDFVNADGNLPDTTRDLTFRFLVRDNHPTAGASVWKEVKFRSTKDAGPFTISYPTDDTVKWTAGTYTEVRWNVSNTDKGLVNCKTVNIKLSTDGGNTFPYTLATRVVNNGLAKVPVPEIATNRARIRVEASDNIFFDISNRNFQIFPATQPGFTVDVNPRAIPQQCLPTPIQYQIQIDDIQGFNSPVTLSLEGSLPGDAIVSFSKNPILPSETSTLTIKFNQQVEGTFALQVKATAGGVSQSIPIQLNTVSNDFSELVTLQPINGQSGIGLSTKFVWKKAPNANSYDFELATSPTFGATIVASVSNLQDTFYTPTQILLEENRLYFWRIRPSNECGVNAFLEPSVFRTATIQCVETASTNVPVNISGSGLPTVNSTLNVPTQGVISDLNLPLILASYQPVKSLRMSLISPSGTEVVLFDQQCGNTLKFETGFDDEAPTDVVCPPDDRLVVRPKQALAAFKGQNTAGTWTLRTKVVTGGFGGGGSIEKWSIEFCSTLSPNNPTLVKNDTLGVPPGQTNTYTKNELEVQDSDNTPIQLKYLLITIPAHGVLTLGGAPLLIGSTFTQQDITTFQLKYTHNGDAARLDNFLFVVEDGTGGWLPTQRAIIKIDENATVGVKNLLDENSILVFPNPTRDVLNVQFNQTLKGALTLSLYNIQGQEVQRTRFDSANNQLQLSTSQLASGMYFLTIRTAEGMVTKKVTVQK